jgi:hypothetical protein
MFVSWISVPRVRRSNLPPPLLAHLLDRIRKRNISANQLGLLADWLDTEPEVTGLQSTGNICTLSV